MPQQDPESVPQDPRMIEYEKQELEFFQFVNQTRQARGKPSTPEDKPTSAPRGLQCLLALTRLLEETVNVKIARLNSEKDWEDLTELRKQAGRMVSVIIHI